MRACKRMLVAGAASLGMFIGSAAGAAEDQPAPTDVDGLTITAVRTAEPESTKTGVATLETPQAVSVITADTMRDQGITRLADALRNVAGVTRSSTYGYFDSYQIRGYDAAYGSFYLDGLTSANVAGTVNELGGLEQVEVVKGPASALYGASPLGGVVNLVSKRPRPDRFLEVGVATGSYGLLETTIDANSPLTADGVVSGRLNLVYRDSDDFVDFAHSQRIYIAPAVTFRIADETTLTFLARYQRDYDSPWSPTTAWGTILPSVWGELPLSFSINGTGANRAVFNQKSKQIGWAFDSKITDWLSFSQNVRYEERSAYWRNWIFAGEFTDSLVIGGVQQGRLLGRLVYGPFNEQDKDFGADSRFTAQFGTGAIRHRVLLGFDYKKNTHTQAGDGNYTPADNDLDILSPDYLAPYVPDPTQFSGGTGTSAQVGLYLHDHISFGERFTVTVGGRWDRATTDGQTDKKFSPAVGATFAITPDASLYASYSKSFTPTAGWQVDVNGNLLPPETGENIEVGAKVRTADGQLSGQAAIYQLTRQNVATEDLPNNPFFYVVTGEQRSRGFEVEGAWRPGAAFELIAAYSYIKAEVTKDTVFPIGMPLANFPEHSLSLWGKYTLQQGPLARLGISAGVVYNSDKHFFEVYDSRLYTLPSYAIWDFGLSYPFGPWTAQLNVDNVTDERYFPDACCLDRVTPGEPRSWRLGLRRTF